MKKCIIITVLIVLSAALAGCGLFDQPQVSPSVSHDVSGEVTVSSAPGTPAQASPTPAPSPSVSPSAIDGDPVTYTDEQTITVEYYDVASDETATATYSLASPGTAQSALDAVNEVYIQNIMGAGSIETNSIVFKGGNIYIDFTQSIYSLNLGSGAEAGVLDSIANAYLNNVQGAAAVYYSVDGQDYSSGHIEIDRNTPYKTK